VPSGRPCSPNCPANQKTDHSKRAEAGPTTLVWAVAIHPLRFYVDLSSGQCIGGPSLSQLPALPIYITFCTLVI
jgi:hypothetical protein